MTKHLKILRKNYKNNFLSSKNYMKLQEQIHEDLIASMKSGETEKRDVLRFLESAIKKRAIDNKKQDLSDEEVQKVIASQIKSRRDSVGQFRAGNRVDLAEPEERAIRMLETYLPEQMGDEEIEALVQEALEKYGVTSEKDMGRAMGAIMPQVQGRADGNRVRKVVQKLLTQSQD